MRSEEIQRLLQRRVHFNCNRYFREGWNFYKFNCCVLFAVTVALMVISIICSLAAHAAGFAIAGRHHHSGYNQPDYYQPDSDIIYPTYYPPYNPNPTDAPYPYHTHTTPQPLDYFPTFPPHDHNHDSTPTTTTTTTTTTRQPDYYYTPKPHNHYSTTPLPTSATLPEATKYPIITPTKYPIEDGEVMPTFSLPTTLPTPTTPTGVVEEDESAGNENTYYDYYYYWGGEDDGGFLSRSGNNRRWRRHDIGPQLVAGAFGAVMMILFGYPLAANCFLAVFNAMRGNTGVRFGDIFTSLTCARYCRMIGLGLLLTIFRLLLTLCFIIPGIWFSVASAFAIPVFADRGVGACTAIRVSIKVINKHFCSFLGFIILLALLQCLGFFCLLIGLFVTGPVAFVSFCYCYHHLVGVRGLDNNDGVVDSESDLPIPPLARPVQVVPVSVSDPIAPPPPPPAAQYNPQPPPPMQYNPQPVSVPPMQYNPTPRPVSSSSPPPPPQYIPTATPVYSPRPLTHAHAYYPYNPNHNQQYHQTQQQQQGVQMQPVVMHAIPVQFAPTSPPLPPH